MQASKVKDTQSHAITSWVNIALRQPTVGKGFKAMAGTAVFILMLLLLPDLSAQAVGKFDEKRFTPVTSDTLIEGWQTGETLTSIVRTGFANNIPVGIVLDGDSLCRTNLPGSSEHTHIAALIDQIQKYDPDYVAEARNQVLYVHPRSMKASTLNAFELKIPLFKTQATSAQDDGISLWMYTRAVLVPGQTSIFSGGMQKNGEMLPPFTLSDASVHDILDRLITLGQGGIWILYEVPADWLSNPATDPYNVFSYAGDQAPVRPIDCPKDPDVLK